MDLILGFCRYANVVMPRNEAVTTLAPSCGFYWFLLRSSGAILVLSRDIKVT